MKRTLLLPVAGLVVALSSLAALPSAEAQNKKTPAKSLDIGLLKQAPKIIGFLADKDHTCIGVLPFQVQKGKRAAGFDAAPLASSLPGRLENALLMSMDPDEKKAMRILREPAAYAAGQKVGAWTKDKKAFAKLFETEFPLAWGKEKAKPTIFLTGTIKSTDDRSLTTVEIVGFTKDSWSKDGIEKFKVSTFVVKTDRALLRDLGYSYVLSRSVLKRNVSADERNRFAVDQAVDEDDGKKESTTRATDIAGIRFDVWFGDEKQSIRTLGKKEGGGGNPTFTLDEIPDGTKITFGLTRVTGEGKRLGAIVKLNGLSIYQMDDRDSIQCLKFLFDPEKKDVTYKFTGYQMDAEGDKLLPFKVLTNEESAARETSMGSRAGWIDIDVFASGEEEQEDQLLISAKGLSRHLTKPATLETLRNGLLKRNNVAMKKKGTTTARGLIVYDIDPVPGQKLSEEDSLKNPVRVGGISIQYFARTKGD